LRALGKCFELHSGQETIAKLDGPQVVEDHVALSRAYTARELPGKAAAPIGVLNPLHTTERRLRCK
jgi:hypothetical protein